MGSYLEADPFHQEYRFYLFYLSSYRVSNPNYYEIVDHKPIYLVMLMVEAER